MPFVALALFHQALVAIKIIVNVDRQRRIATLRNP